MIRILYAAMKKRVNRTNLFVLIFFGTGANFTLIFPFIFLVATLWVAAVAVTALLLQLL